MREKAITEMKAELFKMLANASRIEILYVLMKKEKNVNALAMDLGLSKSSMSQHLTVMRHRGLLNARREGMNVYYRLENVKIMTICALLHEISKSLPAQRTLHS